MNFEYFFASRIVFNGKRRVSVLVVRLAVITIALAVATMEISLSFVQGFETEIQKKVIGFGSHVQIGNFLRELDTEVDPLPMDEPALDSLRNKEYIASISPFVLKEALVKSPDGSAGVELKGVDGSYDWDFFQSVLKEGEIPEYGSKKLSRQILLSKKQAKELKLKVGDNAWVYFLTDPIRQRKVTVGGIYETGMEEFDNLLVICDIKMLQKIWKWDSDEVSGFEVNLKLERLDEECKWVFVPEFPFIAQRCTNSIEVAADEINYQTPFGWGSTPITQIFPDIFDWLSFQHQNVWVILILMTIVAVINMITVVLILIIERTRTIGILKALGLPNFRLRRTFIWNAFFLIALGIGIGNLLGLGLLFSQDLLGWLRVRQEDYFIEVVPVAWVWGRFLFVNIGTILVCTIFMYIPTRIIGRINPVQAIRFS
ncbi:MAG: ABC transporter permease [Bacteroidia bacterium]|nr:ABC transporter permease [Bacteroidia bacterium]